MRASKGAKGHKSLEQKKDSRLQPDANDTIHISGAEGIFNEEELSRILSRYLKRAMKHSRGNPDRITLTIERVADVLHTVPILTITTLECDSPERAKLLITEKLSELGISKTAIKTAFDTACSTSTMRGAALVKMISGNRSEPDKLRGVRASRLGIEKEFNRKLSKRLSRIGLNTDRVKEALILASKVAHHKDIVAELCISDDPVYTIGYIASSTHGYQRIPNIKNSGDMSGGRVFFIKEDADVLSLIKYLEKTPVLIVDNKQ